VADAVIEAKSGFDHGVGHSLLLLYDAKAPYSQKSKYFNGLVHHPFNIIYKFILN
jgi:hypothetical protein